MSIAIMDAHLLKKSNSPYIVDFPLKNVQHVSPPVSRFYKTSSCRLNPGGSAHYDKLPNFTPYNALCILLGEGKNMESDTGISRSLRTEILLVGIPLKHSPRS